MMHHHRFATVWLRLPALVVAIGLLSWFTARAGSAQATATAPAGQQLQFADAIESFVHQDRAAPPPNEAILFIGSSIFRQWTTVKEQMAPLPVFNRAFGGSRTWEVLHYMD